MSQAKVDKYKASKKNRKVEVARAKRNQMLAKVITILALIVVAVWIVFTSYRFFSANIPTKEISVNSTAISDFIETLSE